MKEKDICANATSQILQYNFLLLEICDDYDVKSAVSQRKKLFFCIFSL